MISNAAPGVHHVVATATDPSGNDATLAVVFGIEDAADVTAPGITLTSPAEDAELTYLHEIQGSVTDANLQSYRIELERQGTGETRVVAELFEPVSPYASGEPRRCGRSDLLAFLGPRVT